jgi:hypothetical protein
MSTTTTARPMTPTASAVTSRTYRGSGFAGIASGLLFAASVSTSKLPGGSDTPDDVIRYFGTRGHQVSMVLSGYLMAGAGVAFAWFLVGLLGRLRAEDDPRRPARLFTQIAGAATATLLILAGGVFVALPAPLLFETGAKAGDATVAAGTVGLGVIVIAMLAAGVTIVTSSVLGRRGSLPTWNVWLGGVCGVVLVVASLLWFTMLLFVLWLVATGITLARRGAAAG